MESSQLKDLSVIFLVLCLLTIIIWLPFYLGLSNFLGLDFSGGFNLIYRNFDSLEYVVIAKTWYNPQEIAKYPLNLPAIYYASRFPLFPGLIWVFAPLLGFLKSMIFVSFIFTYLSAAMFYLLVKTFSLTKSPLFLSLVFLMLPARWLVVHSIGSSETVFIFLTLACFYFLLKYERSANWTLIHLSALFGGLAVFTRPTGVLLFLSIGLYILIKNFFIDKKQSLRNIGSLILRYHPYLLMPLSLGFVFLIYLNSFGDFFAFFHSGDNIHLQFLPFSVFNKHQSWVGDIWLEDIIYTLIVSLLGGIFLFKQKLYSLSIFVLTLTTASIFISHRDISRYILPVFPFCLIAFEKLLTSKEFRIVVVIIFLGLVLYSQNFLIENTAPVADLSIFN
jgi:hypothetical protein